MLEGSQLFGTNNVWNSGTRKPGNRLNSISEKVANCLRRMLSLVWKKNYHDESARGHWRLCLRRKLLKHTKTIEKAYFISFHFNSINPLAWSKPITIFRTIYGRRRDESQYKMAASVQTYDSWLTERLLQLNPDTDTDVFVSYITGILEEDVPKEEKMESMTDFISQVVVSIFVIRIRAFEKFLKLVWSHQISNLPSFIQFLVFLCMVLFLIYSQYS